MTDIQNVIEQFHTVTVMVVGDLMLDRYTSGTVCRTSPEAPVVVLQAEQFDVRPGGAASVAALCRGLGARVNLAGVLGADANGRILSSLLQDDGIDCQLVAVDEHRPTTTKERYLGNSVCRQPSQILRVDIEDTQWIPTKAEDEILDRCRRQLRQCHVLLISDYAKGFCTPGIVDGLIREARTAGIPVLVDPGRGVPYERYRGATVIKPNRQEAAEATGVPTNTPENAIAAAQQICGRHGCDWAIVTLDKDGIVAGSADGWSAHVPARIRSVCDITGAGDMVLAALGLCLACGTSVPDAIRLANVAGGLEVERPGVGIISACELRNELRRESQNPSTKETSLAELAALTEVYRRQQKTVVFTNGCFDLLHIGHVTHLQEAAQLGNVLIVAINSDDSVRRLKGASRPVIPQNDRAAMLAALSCVDHVIVFEEDTPHELLRQIRPDVLVKGGTTPEVSGREIVEAYGGTVCTTALCNKMSTTLIVKSIRSATRRAKAAKPKGGELAKGTAISERTISSESH